jgi:hypothetical protein
MQEGMGRIDHASEALKPARGQMHTETGESLVHNPGDRSRLGGSILAWPEGVGLPRATRIMWKGAAEVDPAVSQDPYD